MPIIKTANPFFPSPDEVTIFLGLPTSPREQFKCINRIYGINNLPSDRTLDNISKKGIKLSSIESFIQPFYKFLAPLIKQKPPREVHIADLAEWWEPVIIGLKFGLKSLNGLDISLLETFINKRCIDYKPQFDFMKKASKNIKKTELTLLVEFYDLILKSTLLTAEEQREVHDFFCTINTNIKNNKNVKSSTKSALLLLFNDFWLSLFSVIDNIFINYNNKTTDLRVNKSDCIETGFLGLVLSQNKKTFLDNLFSHIKNITDKTYAELATYVDLPISEFDKIGKTKKEVQIERFKEWRNGKSIPSVKALDRYFQNCDVGEDLIIYAILMRALDTTKEDVSSYTLDNYKRYYLFYKNKTAI